LCDFEAFTVKKKSEKTVNKSTLFSYAYLTEFEALLRNGFIKSVRKIKFHGFIQGLFIKTFLFFTTVFNKRFLSINAF